MECNPILLSANNWCVEFRGDAHALQIIDTTQFSQSTYVRPCLAKIVYVANLFHVENFDLRVIVGHYPVDICMLQVEI